MDELVALQVEAISNLKIDKITVWDSSGGESGSSSTANFISNFVKSIPPLQELSSMVGIELPEYLGRIASEAPPIEAAKKPTKPKSKQAKPKGDK